MRPRPAAYIFVDAMRYEMGAELAERLGRTNEVQLRPALAALPSITPIGMAALLPGSAASFLGYPQWRADWIQHRRRVPAGPSGATEVP